MRQHCHEGHKHPFGSPSSFLLSEAADPGLTGHLPILAAVSKGKQESGRHNIALSHPSAEWH